MLERQQEHWHARELVWRAVGCLAGRGSLRERLIATAKPLVRLGCEQREHPLPEGIGVKLDAVVGALIKHSPVYPDCDFDSGSITSVNKLTPRQRANVAQDIVDILVDLCGGL